MRRSDKEIRERAGLERVLAGAQVYRLGMVSEEAEGPANHFAKLFGPNCVEKARANPKLAPYCAQPDYIQKLTLIAQNPAMVNAFMQDQRIMHTMLEFSGIDMSSFAKQEPPAQPPATVPTVPASVGPPVTPVAPSPVPADPTPLTAPLASAADTRTYDATSADVAPPALLTPVANAPLRAGSRQSPGSVANEIIVNDDGSIASVKATSEPTTIAETLQVFNGLSIAKSWQFDPALRNGQPVKYRLLVPLSTFVIR